jgi:hypothetical protein
MARRNGDTYSIRLDIPHAEAELLSLIVPCGSMIYCRAKEGEPCRYPRRVGPHADRLRDAVLLLIARHFAASESGGDS